ncbi:MAG: hypothetical protein GY711_05105 [bacterium]|nr:hypothetical protein [bacterium]
MQRSLSGQPALLFCALALWLALPASAQIDIVEPFTERFPSPASREDGPRSGARWGNGRLREAIGGGSGRLGDLVVTSGEVLVLNTDSQAFPLPGRTPDLLGNADPITGQFPTSLTVTDGGFEFASIRVEAGGVLRLEGANPARLYSRGRLVIAAGGLVDVSGTTPEAHDSQTPKPEETIARLPSPAGAGDGGFGGDRYDHSGSPQILALSNIDSESDAILNPGAVTRGRDGLGVGRSPAQGEGLGGEQYPALMPSAAPLGLPAFPHGLLMDAIIDYTSSLQCRSLGVGGVGSGGAYATDGTPGVPDSRIPVAQWAGSAAPNNNNAPPRNPGGSAADLGLAPPSPTNQGYVRRTLDWTMGYLAGGAGGGGGGVHAYSSRSAPNTDCIGPTASLRAWHDHSGAAGASGGGAVQLTSGKEVRIDGVVDASGGNGGSSLNTGAPDTFHRFAMPGGAGSGGAVRLQGLRVFLAGTAGRLDVRGGAGGTTAFSASQGGDGGTGLVRVEDFSLGPDAVDATLLAPTIAPYDAANDSVGWLSVAPMAFTPSSARPDSVMASSSCWIRPGGVFNELVFADDSGQTPDRQGWNMTVFWQPNPQNPPTRVPFRGASPLFPTSFEAQFGTLLGHDLAPGESAAPIVVRFQGARSGAPLSTPCGLELDDPVLVPGSVTTWVDHPSKLNGLTPAVDVFRFVVVFDGTRDGNDVPGDVLHGSIRGVTDLRVTVTPQ